MKKQKIALAALGIAGLVLLGAALVSVAHGGNNDALSHETNSHPETMPLHLGDMSNLQYMISSPGGSPQNCEGMYTGWQTNNRGKSGEMHFQGKMKEHQRNTHMGTFFINGHYLNTTRIEGILLFENGTYLVDSTVLYLGHEMFLENMAKSDYDQDDIYEYVWQELDGLLGSTIVVNGVLDDGILMVTHINGIWLRMPVHMEITELEGILEYDNETHSFLIDGTELLLKKRGYPRSDIDSDGSLESLFQELNGLVDETVTMDGTLINGALAIIHINGIWIA
jgi:hypothetical protein